MMIASWSWRTIEGRGFFFSGLLVGGNAREMGCLVWKFFSSFLVHS